MKKESLIAIAVIGGIIFLGLGFSLGLDWAQKGLQKEMEKPKTESPLINLLKSKVIRGLGTIASGEVKEISGRKITLTDEGDILIVSIREDALLYRLLPPKGEATETTQPVVREEIKFGDIKAGDKVNITCQLKADETLEGVDVMVSP